MLGLDAVLGGANVGMSIINGLAAQRKRAQLEAERRQQIQDIQASFGKRANDLETGNLQSFRRDQGIMGDALAGRAGAIAEASRAAGITNNTSDAALVAQEGAQNAAQLAAEREAFANQERNFIGQGQEKVNDLKYNMINDELNNARSNEAGAYQGLQQGLGALTTLNQARGNTNANNPNVTRATSTTVGTTPNVPDATSASGAQLPAIPKQPSMFGPSANVPQIMVPSRMYTEGSTPGSLNLTRSGRGIVAQGAY